LGGVISVYQEPIPNIDGIVTYFNKTPRDIVCPHFWELRWAFGCPYDCDYCYLRGTGWGNKDPRYRPIDRVLRAIQKAFDHKYFVENPCIFNSGELSDSLMNPSRMEQIAEKFEEQGKHKLLLLTKSNNVMFLVEKPRKQTVVSFSLNAPEVWKRWEHRTPSPEKRIEAARMVSEAGYEVRVRVDPIFPIEDWQRHYQDLLYVLLSEIPKGKDPERITLGTPRGLQKTIAYSKNQSWTKYFEEYSKWGKKLSSSQRKEIYLFFCDRLGELGFDKSRISLCKETDLMWKELGMDRTRCRCNCIW